MAGVVIGSKGCYLFMLSFSFSFCIHVCAVRCTYDVGVSTPAIWGQTASVENIGAYRLSGDQTAWK